ncbi:hypothetical protein [Brevundimonas sp.]|uniref:hypothetical protein n=1 Tax=Brevundimonas sp. TaxID=1871086 RepID=UPI00286B4368|nr:hypothetical protein [Brevundimonas sp.]
MATQGAPTTANAHPLRAAKVGLAHNGITETFAALKAEPPKATPTPRQSLISSTRP